MHILNSSYVGKIPSKKSFCSLFYTKQKWTKFLHSYGTDINYIPASKIISSWLFFTNHTSKTTYLNLPLNSAHVEIIFQHERTPNNEWIPLCGWVGCSRVILNELFMLICKNSFICSFRFDSKATFEPTWRTDLCITENLMDNLTRCICPVSGTFVVLFVKKSFNVSWQ